MSEESLIERQRRYLVPGVQPYYQKPLAIESASGRTVVDEEGNQYLDFFGGILTVSIGHSHPAVADAVSDQARKLVHSSTLYVTKPMVDVAQRLADITPGPVSQSFFTTSGTEANETAVTMAQLSTGSSDIIALRHSYSGRSQLGMGLTGQSSWKLGDGGRALPIHHAHNAYCYRCPFKRTPDTCGLECADDFEEFIQTSTSGHIAAYIAEPVQGVGGFITPPPAFLQKTVEVVRRLGGVFIDDEVQTGFGRTGRWFGIEHFGVTPDIMTFAKGMANGLPIGATITTAGIAESYKGPTISTFGGNPLSMRAALATLDVIGGEGLVQNSRERGRQLRDGLENLSDRFAVMGDVRGLGLMQGIELVRANKRPAPDLATKFIEYARRQGILVGKGGMYGNTIRVAPPMTVTREEVTQVLEGMAEVMRAIYQDEPELSQVTSSRIHYEGVLS